MIAVVVVVWLSVMMILFEEASSDPEVDEIFRGFGPFARGFLTAHVMALWPVIVVHRAIGIIVKLCWP